MPARSLSGFATTARAQDTNRAHVRSRTRTSRSSATRAATLGIWHLIVQTKQIVRSAAIRAAILDISLAIALLLAVTMMLPRVVDSVDVVVAVADIVEVVADITVLGRWCATNAADTTILPATARLILSSAIRVVNLDICRATAVMLGQSPRAMPARRATAVARQGISAAIAHRLPTSSSHRVSANKMFTKSKVWMASWSRALWAGAKCSVVSSVYRFLIRLAVMTRPVHLDDPQRPERHTARLDHIARTVLRGKRVVIVSGAGLSVSAGIPDFRSQNGMYALAKASSTSLRQGKDLFDASVFRDSESCACFYQFIAEMHAAAKASKPTRTHTWLAKLKEQNRLLRWYTQNIDNLEVKAIQLNASDTADRLESIETFSMDKLDGLQSNNVLLSSTLEKDDCQEPRESTLPNAPPTPTSASPPPTRPKVSADMFTDRQCFPTPVTPRRFYDHALIQPLSTPVSGGKKSTLKSRNNINETKESISPVVQVHGTLFKVNCTKCRYAQTTTDEIMAIFSRGCAPECPQCVQRSQDRVDSARRPLSVGTLRPAVILYNELHPSGNDIATAISRDIKRRPDVLLVLGTSLKVQGCKEMVRTLAKYCKGPKIFVNLEEVAWSEWGGVFDWWIRGELDAWVAWVEQADKRGVLKTKRHLLLADEDELDDWLGQKRAATKEQAQLSNSGQVVSMANSLSQKRKRASMRVIKKEAVVCADS